MIVSFLSILVILGTFAEDSLGQFTCPYSCVCSEEKQEIRCIGTPQLEILNLLPGVGRKRLRWVYVEGYNIRNLNSSHIDAMVPWLRTDVSKRNGLSLQRNKIVYIRDNAFRHLHSYRLQRVILAHNRLTVLRSGMFNGLSQVEELDLSNNEINSVNPDAFFELKKLGSINLNNNQIVAIAPWTFYSNDLRSLSVSHNKLVNLTNAILRTGQKLGHLDASNNLFLEFSFTQFRTSFFLNLDDNLLSCIDFRPFFSFTDEAPQSTNSYIYLRRNKIQRIIPPQVCRTSSQRQQTVNTSIFIQDNLIPETFSPLSLFPCANVHFKNYISGKMYLNLEGNCFCQESKQRVGGLEILAKTGNCKYINNCPAEDPHLPNACSGGFINPPHTITPPKPTPRFSPPKPRTTTITTDTGTVKAAGTPQTTKATETTDVAETTETTEAPTDELHVLGLRESVLYSIAASCVVCVVIIIVTVVVCCLKKRQATQTRRESLRQQQAKPDADNNRQPQYQSNNRNTPHAPVDAAPRYETSFFQGGAPNLPRAASEGHLNHQAAAQQLSPSTSTPALDNSDAHSDYTYMYLDTNEISHVGRHVPYHNAHKLRGQDDFLNQNNFSLQNMHVVQ